MASKLNKVWIKFSKLKTTRFNNEYVNTALLQSFMSTIDSDIIIVNFISESDLLIYNLGQKSIHYKVERFSTLIEMRTFKLMDHK